MLKLMRVPNRIVRGVWLFTSRCFQFDWNQNLKIIVLCQDWRECRLDCEIYQLCCYIWSNAQICFELSGFGENLWILLILWSIVNQWCATTVMMLVNILCMPTDDPVFTVTTKGKHGLPCVHMSREKTDWHPLPSTPPSNFSLRPYLRFWYQVLTCVSVRLREAASSIRSWTLRYFWRSKLRSSCASWWSVKAVRAFLGFLSRTCGLSLLLEISLSPSSFTGEQKKSTEWDGSPR